MQGIGCKSCSLPTWQWRPGFYLGVKSPSNTSFLDMTLPPLPPLLLTTAVHFSSSNYVLSIVLSQLLTLCLVTYVILFSNAQTKTMRPREVR